MKRVLITGADGFIGAHLVKRLSEQNIEIIAVCHPDSPFKGRLNELSNVYIVSCDLLNTKDILRRVPGNSFDVLYHLAWENPSGEVRQNYEGQIKNLMMLPHLLSMCQHFKCKKIVATGTVSENLCDEIDLYYDFFPSSFYLFAKKSTFSLLRQLSLKEKLNLVWCTFCHPIGLYNKPDQLIAKTVLELQKGNSPVFQSGDNWFDIIAVEDLAEALFLAGKQELTQSRYYIGSGAPRLLKDYLLQVGQIVAPDIPMRFNTDIRNTLQLKKDWLNAYPFYHETGFEAKISFDEAVRRTQNWLEPNFLQ